MGIVNGTTNFILSKMTSDASDYGDALAEAQALGYAEADPTADVEAYDAAAKVQILSSLAFGTELRGEEISREGITRVRSIDVEFARRAGYVIKLLGVAERVGESGISRRVHPAMMPDGPSARLGARRDERRLRRRGEERSADVAGSGRRWRADGDGGAR